MAQVDEQTGGPRLGPTGAPKQTEGDEMLIDRQLPEFDETVVRHLVVNASTDATWRAVRSADLMEVGDVMAIARALSWLRDLPERVGLAGNQEGPPERLTLDDLSNEPGWIKLGEDPGRELVLGAVGKFWKPRIDWLPIDPSDFTEFAEADYAKLAVAVSVRPYGADRALISYEARTATTSELARKRFRWYWRLIGWGAAAMMSGALKLMQRDAEATDAA